MQTNRSNADADKAAEFAKKAEKLVLGAPEQAAAYASLAVYHQLRAAEDQQGTLAKALQVHGVAMQEFGAR